MRRSRPALFRRAVWSAVALIAFVVAGAAFAGEPSERETIRQGRFLYEIYCLNCHGDEGRGEGPTAEVLTVKPTDLTRIAGENDGEFPEDEVRRGIDGRDVVRAHGRSQMPIWGLSFQQFENDSVQEHEVQTKIEQLLAYLRSVQADGEGRPLRTPDRHGNR